MHLYQKDFYFIRNQFNPLLHLTEQTCKPGSVLDNYLSRIYISEYLKPPKNSRASLNVMLGCCIRWGLHASRISRTAVSSYLGFSSLPQLRRLFSVALSLELPPPGVTRHPALCCPDFPHSEPYGFCPQLFGLLICNNTIII